MAAPANVVAGILELALQVAADIKSLTANKADKTAVVNITGDQTVDGNKTFAKAIAVLPIPTLTSNSQLTPKSYVDSEIAKISGGTPSQVPASYIPVADRDLVNVGFSRRQTYIIPKEDLLNYGVGATDAVKAAAFANNNAKAKAAVQAYPFRTIEFDMSTGEFWPLSFAADDRDTTAYPTQLAYRLKGRFKQATGTFPTQAAYDAYAADGTNPNGYVPARPVVEIIRGWGAPQDISSITVKSFGPTATVPWYLQTQQATAIALTTAANITTWEQGDSAVICSNNSYDYAVRAGYDQNNVWHSQKIQVADIGMDVTSYTISAASSASVTAGGPPLVPNGTSSANGMEGRILRGASSGTTALVRGDTGGGQLLFTKLTAAFSANESLIDDATGSTIGTMGGMYVIVSGKLTNSFTTTPAIRKVPRNLPVTMDIEVMLDGDPSAKIAKWNRCPEVALTGTYDHNVKINIKGGSQRGLALTSCFRGYFKVIGGKLPNHAMEQVNPKEEAYGYGCVVLGCSEDFDVELDVEDVRHGFSSNVLGGKWNLTSGGVSGTHAQSTNYHKYGTSRDIRVRGRIYYTFGACIDTHEGMDKLLVHNFKVGKSFWGGRNLSMGAGINTRGTNTVIRDGIIEEVKVGIFDSSQSTPIGESGFRSDTYIKDVIVLKAQAGGYMTNDDATDGQAATVARTFIDGCTFEGDLDIPTTMYVQAGIITNRAYVVTRNVFIRKQNSAMIIHKGSTSTETPPLNGGVGIHVDPTFDFTEGSANTMVRYETHMSTTAVVGYTIFANGNLRPAYEFRHMVTAPTAAQISAGMTATNVQWSGRRLIQMTSTAAVVVQTQNESGAAGTATYLGDPGKFFVPPGGTTGQVLKKASNTDGDLVWGDDVAGAAAASLPAGGTTGQYLRKSSTTDGDAAWNYPASYSNVTLDGVKQATIDISSEAPIRYLSVPAAGETYSATASTIAAVASLQTNFSVGTYYIKALMYYQVPTSGNAVRFGFGGAGAAGATIDNIHLEHHTSVETTNGRYSFVLTALGAIGASAVNANPGKNTGGNSTTTVNTSLEVAIEGKIIVTTAGQLGVVWWSPQTGANKLMPGSILKIERMT